MSGTSPITPKHAKAGDFIHCQRCGECHELRPGYDDSEPILLYRCGGESYMATLNGPTEVEAQPLLVDLLCPVHAQLSELKPFDNCIACIRNERDLLEDANRKIGGQLLEAHEFINERGAQINQLAARIAELEEKLSAIRLDDQAKRLNLIETHILNDHFKALPRNWVYTDSETTLDLMVAEILTLRAEAEKAGVQA